jgi:hypothetical protein
MKYLIWTICGIFIISCPLFSQNNYSFYANLGMPVYFNLDMSKPNIAFDFGIARKFSNTFEVSTGVSFYNLDRKPPRIGVAMIDRNCIDLYIDGRIRLFSRNDIEIFSGIGIGYSIINYSLNEPLIYENSVNGFSMSPKLLLFYKLRENIILISGIYFHKVFTGGNEHISWHDPTIQNNNTIPILKIGIRVNLQPNLDRLD